MAQSCTLKQRLLLVTVVCAVTVLCFLLVTSDSQGTFSGVNTSAYRRTSWVYNMFIRAVGSTDAPTEFTEILETEEEASVHQRFERRRAVLQAACNSIRNSSGFSRLSLSLVSQIYKVRGVTFNVKYCPIPKTSSTTWRHLLKKLKDSKSVTITSNVSNAVDVSFAFVRDPYMRLLSAYTDKLFSPNGLFWSMHGSSIVRVFRENATKRSIQCGHDVTFAEFIRYVLQTQTSQSSLSRDRHFVPVHDHCDWCLRDYQYIGHLETISQDMPYVLKIMRSPVKPPQDFGEHTLQKNADMVFNRMRHSVEACISWEEACRRLWKKWQIRGIISKDEPFPLTKQLSVNITLDMFRNVTLEVFRRSRDKTDKHSQKREALREAFASVSYQDVLKLRNMLSLDFKLFGFDPSPDDIFGNRTEAKESNFSYFDLYS